jgi:hypothetical protein
MEITIFICFCQVIGPDMKRQRIEGEGIVFIDVKHCYYIFLRDLVEVVEDPSGQTERVDEGTGGEYVCVFMQDVIFSNIGYGIAEIDGIGGIGFQGIKQSDVDGFSVQTDVDMRQVRSNVDLVILIFKLNEFIKRDVDLFFMEAGGPGRGIA